MGRKVKIVLDADVIIHFAKGGLLHLLPSILPGYEFIVLDKVREEIQKPALTQLQNQMAFMNNIREVKFGETVEERREFARLRSELCLGKGESACMAYCKYNHDVVGSSNLTDIKDYCLDNQITFLTTIEFLYYGIIGSVITKKDAVEFIRRVNSQNSRLPEVDFETFVCTKI